MCPPELKQRHIAKTMQSQNHENANPFPSSSTTTTTPLTTTASRPRKTLQDRKRIPFSIYLTVVVCLLLQFAAGVWNASTLILWKDSMCTAWETFLQHVYYLGTPPSSTTTTSTQREYAQTVALAFLTLSVVYVFFLAPLKAGLWTGQRAKRHLVHRYGGLTYMLQYAAAWLEFGSQYNPSSNITHFISINGLVQGISAFVSFKVLPELEDAGYISDKAVLSRNFVHENIFFTLMVYFGSIYYQPSYRAQLQSTTLGRVLEALFVFWPYVLIRIWFPITRFRNAGTTHNGRTKLNQTFYEISTVLIKIFFLWAKYFLGFYINFLVYLDLLSPQQWQFVHGLYLLNAGTVSLAVFLHTMRFKKVLPPKVTMSIYLLQIYLTFVAIPMAYPIFVEHLPLCGLTLAGLLCNMTRSRAVHAVWCGVTMLLLCRRDYSQYLGQQFAW
ncbi:hypothetical protein FisN_25Lh018 [Fistulifera solaris]|uniref:Uncharacterized protein n=1 Tax=Fistulifera solaris TaxID=1519565 RepID=A0A1Z5JLX3_FISSO|nr:hypothetical protein FisN_25Lh018 [Fistulifera solaris]|eukprot:GAX14788.1 hypothetical protein FisN_25Lh018 [Fistulifera solaris]